MQRNYARNYFDFQGKRYGIGTVVQLKYEGCSDRREFKRCNGVAVFESGLTSGYLRFRGVVPSGEYRCGLVIFDSPEDRIEKIITPVYYVYKPTWQIALENYQKTPKSCRADIAPGTILYIAALLVSAIFKGAIVLWVMITIVYLVHLINIYRD
jgi:hypothetical protein